MDRGEIDVLLLPAAIVLCVASWLIMLEYSCSRTHSEVNIDLDEGAHGVEIRRWVQVTLSLAALCRAVALGLDMLYAIPFVKYAEYRPYHFLADVLYVAVYSLLTLFCAQLCLLAKGNREKILRSIVTVGFSSFFVVFGTTVILLASTEKRFHKTLDNMALAELGAANGIVGTLILYFGVRVIIFTQIHGNFAVRKPWALNCRTILLTLVCNGVCLLRCGMFLAFITGIIQLKDDSSNSSKWEHMYGVYVWVTDVVPTWVVFLLTVRWQGRKPHRFTSRDFRTYRLPTYGSQGFLGAANLSSPFKEDHSVSPVLNPNHGALSYSSNSHRCSTANQENTGINANPMHEDYSNESFVLPTQ